MFSLHGSQAASETATKPIIKKRNIFFIENFLSVVKPVHIVLNFLADVVKNVEGQVLISFSFITSRRKILYMKKRALLGVVLLISIFVFQGQSYYRNYKTGYHTTKESGAAFGYYVPRSINKIKKDLPLVIVFSHSAMEAMKWKALADRENLIVLSVQPMRGGRWVLQADYPRAEKKIKEMMKRYPVDKDKVWATGYRFAGNFALLMGINSPELFKAVVGVDSPILRSFISAGDAGDGQFVGVFDFQKNPKRQIPILLIDFEGGNFVSEQDRQDNYEVLEKYGYPVSFETFPGNSHKPGNREIKKIYSWFKKHS